MAHIRYIVRAHEGSRAVSVIKAGLVSPCFVSVKAGLVSPCFVSIEAGLVHALCAFRQTSADDLAFIVVSQARGGKIKNS